MKKNVIIVLLLIIIGRVYSQNNDLHNLDLNDKIKSIETFLNTKKQRIITFNEDGNILDYKTFDLKTGKLFSYYFKKYDTMGREVYYEDEFYTTIKQYNDLEKSEIQIKTLKRDTTYFSMERLDKNNLKIFQKRINYSNNNRFTIETTEYKYDTLNRLITENCTKKILDGTIFF